jgi:hypothetical protein
LSQCSAAVATLRLELEKPAREDGFVDVDTRSEKFVLFDLDL